MEPAPLLAELGLDGVDEGGEVVAGALLELCDPLRGGRLRLLSDRPRLPRRDDAQLGPCVQRGELDLEPRGELPLVRPHLGHGRAGVAGDHSARS